LWHWRVDNPPLYTSSAYRSVLRRNEIVLPLPFAMWDASMLWQAETGFYYRMADGYVGALLPAQFASELGTLSAPTVQPQPAAFLAFLHARQVQEVLVDVATAGFWPAVLNAAGLHARTLDGVLVYRVPR
jgi:hypothetical protein